MNIIIDANNLLFRAGYNLRFNEDDEICKNGVAHKFLQILQSYYKKYDPSEVYLCWDKRLDPSVSNFRKEIIPEYKQGREKSETTETIVSASDLCIDLTSCLGFHNLFPKHAEADDVIYFLSHTLEGPNIVISADKDLYQCISETCSIFNPYNKKTLNLENFQSNTGVSVNRWALYLSIWGDDADNVKGLNRFGKIKSARLANDFESNAPSLSQEQKDIIQRNLKVIDLKKMNIEDELKSYQKQLKNKKDLNMSRFTSLCKEIGIFKSEIYSWNGLMVNDILSSL